MKSQISRPHGSRRGTDRQSHVLRSGRPAIRARDPHHPGNGEDEEDHREKLQADDECAALVYPIATTTNHRVLRELLGALVALDETLAATNSRARWHSGLPIPGSRIMRGCVQNLWAVNIP